jgi:hypothetical protein
MMALGLSDGVVCPHPTNRAMDQSIDPSINTFKYQHLGDMMALGLQEEAVAFSIDGITLDGQYQ